MAQKVQVTFVDDLDGTAASGTTLFALDGKDYEIDLSDVNTDKLRGSLAPFIAAARRAGGRRRGPSPAPLGQRPQPRRHPGDAGLAPVERVHRQGPWAHPV